MYPKSPISEFLKNGKAKVKHFIKPGKSCVYQLFGGAQTPKLVIKKNKTDDTNEEPITKAGFLLARMENPISPVNVSTQYHR